MGSASSSNYVFKSKVRSSTSNAQDLMIQNENEGTSNSQDEMFQNGNEGDGLNRDDRVDKV